MGNRLPYSLVGKERMRELRAGSLSLGCLDVRIGEVDHDPLDGRAGRGDDPMATVRLDRLEQGLVTLDVPREVNAVVHDDLAGVGRVAATALQLNLTEKRLVRDSVKWVGLVDDPN